MVDKCDLGDMRNISYKIPPAFAGMSGFPNALSCVQQTLSSPPMRERDRGFSLAEVLAALTIGAMILVAVLGIYSRAERSAVAITRRFDSSRLPCEILQRIAEDLDGIVAAGPDTTVTIKNGYEWKYPTTRLTIEKTYGTGRERQIFEKIIWQSSIDDDANGLVLYRSHSGITSEDKLLDESKDSADRELFVPICDGITFFRIQVPIYRKLKDEQGTDDEQYEEFQDEWSSTSLPKAIVATISFAEPLEMLDGSLDVPDEEKITRVIAIDRTRKITFIFTKKEYEDEESYKEEDKEEQGKEEEDKEAVEDKQEDKKVGEEPDNEKR